MPSAPRRFVPALAAARGVLQSHFARPRSLLIGAAGRLSPEKGFDLFVEAAASVVRACPEAGFVLFGDGPLRATIAGQIARLGLADHFVLAGFRDDLDRLLTGFDLTVLPSYTEGLPNVVLETVRRRRARGRHGCGRHAGGRRGRCQRLPGAARPTGPPGRGRILAMLSNETLRGRMGLCGQRRVREHFTFEAQARRYQTLFETLVPAPWRLVEPARAA